MQGNCAIERKLDEGIERIAEEAKELAQNVGPHGYPSRRNGRIPSWLALPQLTAFPAGTVASASGHESPSRATAAATGTTMTALAVAPAIARQSGVDSPMCVGGSCHALADGGSPSARSSAPPNGCIKEPEVLDTGTGHERDLGSRENGLAVLSTSPSSGEVIRPAAERGCIDSELGGFPEQGRSPQWPRPRRNSSGGSSLHGQGGRGGGSISPQHGSRGGKADGVRRPYGAGPDGPSWKGLRPLAQTVERTVGLGGRVCSSYSLDVMAP
jgi:hypothetical protein